MPGRISIDIARLTTITTASGSTAMKMPGNSVLRWPCSASAGSKLCAAVARSRTTVSWDATDALISASKGPPKPSPAPRAAFSARASHHSPKPSITADAMSPSPGAAKAVVPKKGIGMAFWMAGVPGMAVIVKVVVPSATAAGSSRLGMLAARNSAWPIGAMTNMATNRLTPP